MKRQARGNSNEHRTIKFLAKREWVSVRAGASKGMLDIDVLAYHIKTGQIKHIQCKSNRGYTREDINTLILIRKHITAPNVSVELWDWHDGVRYPVIIRMVPEDPSVVEYAAWNPLSRDYIIERKSI